MNERDIDRRKERERKRNEAIISGICARMERRKRNNYCKKKTKPNQKKDCIVKIGEKRKTDRPDD